MSSSGMSPIPAAAGSSPRAASPVATMVAATTVVATMVAATIVAATIVALGALPGCADKQSEREQRARPEKIPRTEPQPAKVKVTRSNKATVDIGLAYSSEIEGWMVAAIDRFNSSRESKNGKYIVKVHGNKVDSAKVASQILGGIATPHLWVPASDLYRVQLNQGWEAKYKRGADIAPAGTSLVSSPVVIAMWKSMAEALGAPGKALGWADIRRVATDAKGWEALGHKEWGRFKLGLPNPGPSAVGIMSLLSAIHAASPGTSPGASNDSLQSPAVREFVRGIESSVLHYDATAQFFAEKMLQRGSDYLHAVAMPESMVFEASKDRRARRLPDSLVAIYPAEGSLVLDYPLVVLDGIWVEERHREASRVLLEFLRGAEMQAMAVRQYGLRPSDAKVDISAALTAGSGVDAAQPGKRLPAPTTESVDNALAFWREVKKPSDVIVVLERSSALVGPRFNALKRGAVDFLRALGKRTRVGLVLFNDKLPATVELVDIEGNRDALIKQIDDSVGEGGNAFRDAIALAHRSMPADPKGERIRAIVALTASYDQFSKITDDALVAQLANPDSGTGAVPVFIISYGSGYEVRLLRNIAEVGGGSLLVGDGKSIREVYGELATFF